MAGSSEQTLHTTKGLELDLEKLPVWTDSALAGRSEGRKNGDKFQR